MCGLVLLQARPIICISFIFSFRFLCVSALALLLSARFESAALARATNFSVHAVTRSTEFRHVQLLRLTAGSLRCAPCAPGMDLLRAKNDRPKYAVEGTLEWPA